MTKKKSKKKGKEQHAQFSLGGKRKMLQALVVQSQIEADAAEEVATVARQKEQVRKGMWLSCMLLGGFLCMS